jgi:hypothetical protein
LAGLLPTRDQILPRELISDLRVLQVRSAQRNHHHRPSLLANRDFAPRLEFNRIQKEEGTTMNKFGFAAVVASGLVAAILGLAAPAQADTAVKTPVIVASAINIPTDFGHHAWVVDIQPQTNVPHR